MTSGIATQMSLRISINVKRYIPNNLLTVYDENGTTGPLKKLFEKKKKKI